MPVIAAFLIPQAQCARKTNCPGVARTGPDASFHLAQNILLSDKHFKIAYHFRDNI